ncbi:hypothetical protein [Kribbella lupini]|uniref:Uncharacterized protein n=1 Tax=Kribbella lupini TaxID=291602 RepID=A0ABP4LU43_9ACTN
MNDPAETLVTRSLESHAGSAPSDATLLGTVHRRLRRRRRARTAGAAVLACAAVAVVGVGIHSLVRPEVAPAPSVAQPPAGWHWESYANVEVQVPDAWTEINAGHLATCPKEKARMAGWVGRPSMLPGIAMGCGVFVGGGVDVGAPANRVPYVLFDFNAAPGVTRYDAGWTKEVRAVGALKVEVFGTDDAVRERVLASARVIEGADSNGCAPTHPVATQPSYRPAGDGLASVGTVESIGICAYNSTPYPRVPPLLASAGLTGDQAREVGAALLDAPLPDIAATSEDETGRTPLSSTHSSRCATSDNEVLVLQVRGDRGEQEVVVRLDSCGPLDTNDGQRIRLLTKASAGPLLDAVGRPEERGPLLTRLLK